MLACRMRASQLQVKSETSGQRLTLASAFGWLVSPVEMRQRRNPLTSTPIELSKRSISTTSSRHLNPSLVGPRRFTLGRVLASRGGLSLPGGGLDGIAIPAPIDKRSPPHPSSLFAYKRPSPRGSRVRVDRHLKLSTRLILNQFSGARIRHH